MNMIMDSNEISVQSASPSTTSSKTSKFSGIDLEIQIQNERIIAILTEAIYKAEIVTFIISFNEENLYVAKQIIPENVIHEIEEFSLVSDLDTFLDNVDYQTVTNDQVQQVVILSFPKVMPKFSQLIWNIMNYPLLKPIIKNKIAILREDCKLDNSKYSGIILYVDSLIKLKTKFEDKLYLSAAEKLKKEIMVRNLSKTNKALKLKIADATKRLSSEKDNFKRAFDEKEDLIKNLQERLDLVKHKCRDEISKILYETESEMNETQECHNTKMNILKEKDEESKEHYECLLRENLDTENHLRTSRRKVESELLYWLQQYDKDVGYKQSVLDDLTNCYEEKQKRYKELQNTLELQEKTYIPLMAQKEEEYQRDVLHKMTTFLMEHAARIIQRAWRKILQARAEKKRLKKLASKKKKIKDSSTIALQI